MPDNLVSVVSVTVYLHKMRLLENWERRCRGGDILMLDTVAP